jgi:hypothetical protein
MGFADGFNSGLSAVSNFAGLLQKKKEMDRADALEKSMSEANKAGSEAYQAAIRGATQSTRMTAGDMDAQPGFGQSSQLGLNGAVSLGGAPSLGDQVAAPQQMGGMAPNAAQGLGQSLTLGGAQAPAQQTVTKQATDNDDREAILAGMKARRGHLMKSGVDPKAWMPDWAQEAKLRGEIRSERLDDADKRFATTGDPMEWAKVVYPLVDDGKTLKSAEPFKNLDGATGWNFKVRNDDTGEVSSRPVTTEQFDRMRMMAKDPKAAMEYEAKILVERMKALNKRENNSLDSDEEDRNNERQHRRKLAQLEFDAGNDRKLKGMESGDSRSDNSGIKPKDRLSAVNAEIKDIRDQRMQLGREHTEAMKNATGEADRKRIQAAYDRQITDLDAATEEASSLRGQLRPALGLSLGSASPYQAQGLQSSQAAKPTQKQQVPVKVTSQAQYKALPSGASYIAPDGSSRRKP